MASYYNTEKAAELLGVTPADVNRMRERRELNGYRDGADWKFKVEDVEAMIAKRSRGGEAEADSEDDSVLLSEVTLGESDSGSSGTVIGMDDSSGESDIHLSEDDGLLAPDLSGGSLSELDLTLEDSGMSLGEGSGEHPRSDHALDDELALGGSGSGSDITIGGDSGISLVDPADSGLSLDDPLEFSSDTGSDETLTLGEDDGMFLEEPEKGGSGDFVLEPPRDEGSEGEDSDSGSQVIALDLEAEGDEDATMISGAAGPAPAALPDDFGAMDVGPMSPTLPVETAPTFGAAPGVMPTAGGEPGPAVVVAPPEAPYSALNVVSLALCCLLLAFCGMFMYDLMRNMWSWSGEYGVNSSMMDFLLSLFES